MEKKMETTMLDYIGFREKANHGADVKNFNKDCLEHLLNPNIPLSTEKDFEERLRKPSPFHHMSFT